MKRKGEAHPWMRLTLLRYVQISFGRRPCLLHLSGRTLVIPSACGSDEIYHLKQPLLRIFSLTQMIRFVKNFLVAKKPSPLLFVDFHEGDDGVLVMRRISKSLKAQNELELTGRLCKLL